MADAPEPLDTKEGWTPPPWVVHDTIDGPLSNTDVRDIANRWVARCAPMNGRPHVSVAESEANARLIAAAPVCAEANRLTIEALNSEYRIPASADDNWIYDELGSALSGAYFAARAALALARGEQL